MPRDLRARENMLRAKARRTHALNRLDLREPSSPREPASGPTSHALKARDPELQRMIEEALAKRGQA